MTDECLFCKIVGGEVDSDRVYEDEHVVAFNDIDPQAPTHVLLVPREHVRDWNDLVASAPQLIAPVVSAVPSVAAAAGVDHYRVVANTGERALQSVFHFHLHVLGGRTLQWPPG